MPRAPWQNIPTGVLDASARAGQADAWAAQQHAQLADDWATMHLDQLNETARQLAEQNAPAPDVASSEGGVPPGPFNDPQGQAEQGYGGSPTEAFAPSPVADKAMGGYAPDAVVESDPTMGAIKKGVDQGTGNTPDIPPMGALQVGPFRMMPPNLGKPTQPPADTTEKIVNDQPLDAQDFVSGFTKSAMNQNTSPAAQEQPGLHVGSGEDFGGMPKTSILEDIRNIGRDKPEIPRTPENGYAAAMVAPGGGGGGAGAGISVAGSAAIDKTNKMFEEATTHAAQPLGRRMDALVTTLTRKVTDAGVDLSNLEKDAQRILGRPLNADEMASVQARLNPFYTARVAVDEGVKPAIKDLPPEDYANVRNILTWKGNVDVAAAKGNPDRAFSGSLSAAESQAALDELKNRLGPQKFGDLENRGQAVVDFNKAELQKDVDAGLVTSGQAQKWLTDYPNYTPVVIADYLKEQGRSLGGGRSLGVSANGVKSLTVEGTERARIDPIGASVDAAYQGEALRRQNAAFNALYNLTQQVPELGQMFQVEKGGYTGATKYEKSVTGFVNGEKYTLTTPFEDMARVLKQEGTAPIPGIGPAMQLYKELITGRNPTFLVGNAAIDAPVAILRQAAREGGAQNIPGVLVDLFKGYADAFKGILTGEYKGAATRGYLAGGGGMGSYYAQTAQSGAKEIERLRRGSVLMISSPADVGRVLKDVLKLEPVKAIGERVELGPRAMAYKRTLEKGASQTDAVLAGRDITVDFAQGGSFAKLVNQFVPFLNPAIQGAAQVVREARANPRGTLMTLGPALVGPALAVEAWNNADPERAAAYKDVPDYLKDRGVVVMLPGPGGKGVVAPTDEKGEPRPQFVTINLRELAPITMMTREGFNRVVGNDHRTAASLLGGVFRSVSPIQDFSQALLPGVKTGAELVANRDMYRGADIVTNRNDAQSSALSQGIASGTNRVLSAGGGNPSVRPSAVDYAIRDTTGGVGEMVRGASDIVAGRTKDSQTPQDIPGAGGFIRRLVRGDTGQQLQSARDERLSTPIRQALYDAGLPPDIAVVGQNVGKIPLSKGEQAVYQRAMNAHVNEVLGEVVRDPEWRAAPPDIKKVIVQKVVEAARKAAGAEALAGIKDADLERRLTRKAS